VHTYLLQFYKYKTGERVDDENICFYRPVGKFNVLEITGKNQFLVPVIFGIFI
jgi:hypothetical protein